MRPYRDLDRELRDLGASVEYPPTPDLAGSVRGRLEAEAGGSGPSTRTRPQLWWIAAAALALLVAVPVFSLALRETGTGAFSAGGGAAGDAAGSGGGGLGAEPARPPENAAAGLTHSAQEEGGLAVGAGSSAAAGSVEGACGFPAPLLRVRPERGAPGAGFVLRGENFVDAASARSSPCDDTPTFNERSDAGSHLAPPREVRLDFRQGERTWKLGVVRPGQSLGFRLRLRVPEDARPGSATITATGEGVLVPSRAEFVVSQK